MGGEGGVSAHKAGELPAKPASSGTKEGDNGGSTVVQPAIINPSTSINYIPSNNDNGGVAPAIDAEENDDEAAHSATINRSGEESEIATHDASRFEPLRTQWRYGQVMFARYKKTPYFYSDNIATYLGAGLFMVVFDDGTLNYRVRREDIVLREYPNTSEESQDDDESSVADHKSSSSEVPTDRHASSKSKSSPLKKAHQHWHSNSSIVHHNHMMVDFSISPPKQIALRGDGQDVIGDDELLALKQLECDVGYEDDLTQVSDLDESSEEDMSMTPWQQMTQTFGMGKVRPRASRWSSISSLSQIDRLSITGKGMNQILLSPKGSSKRSRTICRARSRKCSRRLWATTSCSLNISD